MNESSKPLFVDLNPDTGEAEPTTYDSMRAAMLEQHPIFQGIPEDIQTLLLTSIEYFALAYEQANVGRTHLYQQLTNDAFVKATLALELGLRERLARGSRVRLEKLISSGIEAGFLPSSDEHEDVWKELRENRNAIAHGDSKRSSYGPMTGRFFGTVIDALDAMYGKAKVESPSDTAHSTSQVPADTPKSRKQQSKVPDNAS